MERDQDDKDEGHQQSKRRRTQSKYNKQATRYECFCTKQYLSYPALYLHLKNKHNTYFQSTKGGKKVESTKLVQSFDNHGGYKVFKIPMDSVAHLHQNGKKDIPTPAKKFDVSFPPQNPLFFPPGNYLPYPYQPYHFELLPSSRDEILLQNPKMMNIETAFSKFMDRFVRVSMKERVERELILILLIECLNRNFPLLRDDRINGKEVRRYTAEYNCEYISRIFSYFQEVYLPELTKVEEKPQTFFLRHANIITSQNYKNVLKELENFVNNRKPTTSAVNPLVYNNNEQQQQEESQSKINDQQFEGSLVNDENQEESE